MRKILVKLICISSTEKLPRYCALNYRLYFYTVIHLNTAIIREKEKFEALFQHASLGILVANEKGLIEMVNACLLEQFNYPSADQLIA